MKSRVKREFHARFSRKVRDTCGKARVRFPCLTRLWERLLESWIADKKTELQMV